jgi:hypothetical protein
MLVLRFAGLLAVAVWLGGLLALGAVAAPAIFQVIAERQIPDARVLSGAVFGEILRRFHLVGYACGALIVVVLFARRLLGPRPRWFGLRLGIATAMLSAALYSGLVTTSTIVRMQRELGPGVAASSLPQGDPRRATFEHLHRQSTLLHFVPIVGGIALLLLELGDKD